MRSGDPSSLGRDLHAGTYDPGMVGRLVPSLLCWIGAGLAFGGAVIAGLLLTTLGCGIVLGRVWERRVLLAAARRDLLEGFIAWAEMALVEAPVTLDADGERTRAALQSHYQAAQAELGRSRRGRFSWPAWRDFVIPRR